MGVLTQGTNFSGIAFKGEKLFAFVPGLKLWLQYGSGMQPSSGPGAGRVEIWKDQSDNSMNYSGALTGNTRDRNPIDTGASLNFQSGDTTPTSLLRDAGNSYKLNFLNGGVKRGFYTIVKTKYSVTDGDENCAIRTGTQGAGSPDSYRVSFFSSSRNISYAVRINGVNVTRTINAAYTDDTYFLFRDILKTNNTADNHKMYVDNSVLGTFTENRSPSPSTNIPADNSLTKSGANTEWHVKIVLAYDWDAYTDSEIDAFDTQVMEILKRIYPTIITW